MTDLTADIFGWIGAGALLVAYALISAGRLKADDGKYQGLNVFGSVGLMVNSTFYGAYPSTALNIIWIAIAGITFVRIFRNWRDRGTAAPPP
ncbi:MAG: hypothetical protein ACC655_01780 [Rhodothermia bacterium]